MNQNSEFNILEILGEKKVLNLKLDPTKTDGLTFNNFCASKWASSIAAKQFSSFNSHANLVGVGGINSGLPFAFPFSSYLTFIETKGK
jgi:hypothetical protein